MLNPSSNRIMPRLLLAILLVPSILQAAPSAEYQLKASYLYHFTKFITWPESALAGNGKFFICVLGQDPFGKALDALAGKPTPSGDIDVQRHGTVDAAAHCQLTFVNLGNREADYAALSKLTRSGSLTIGEADEFLARGGVMRFVTVDDRVRFEISEANVRRAHLAVGAKLLSVAIRK